MKEINVTFKNAEYKINIPTSRKDITNSYLEEVTQMLDIAPNYSLVALITIEEFVNVVNPSTKKQSPFTAGIPVFVRAGETDDNFINNISCGQTIIISDSDLSMGHHINSPYNKISKGYLSSLLSQDKQLASNAWSINEKCYFLSFKLVPNCNIHGAISEEEPTVVDHYVVRTDINA